MCALRDAVYAASAWGRLAWCNTNGRYRDRFLLQPKYLMEWALCQVNSMHKILGPRGEEVSEPTKDEPIGSAVSVSPASEAFSTARIRDSRIENGARDQIFDMSNPGPGV